MSGYVGQRAKKRKRRTIYVLSIITLIILFYIIFYSQGLFREINQYYKNENDTPSANSLTQEEYDLLILEKDQKIIFRDNTIRSLKENISLLNQEKNKLSETIKILDFEIITNENNLKMNSEKEINQLKLLISQLQNEKKGANKEKKNIEQKYKINEEEYLIIEKEYKIIEKKYKIIEKEYKIIASQNLKLHSELKDLKIKKDNLEVKILEFKMIIDEKEKLIKKLSDVSHH